MTVSNQPTHSVSERVRAAAVSRHITQQAMAQALGLSQGAISRRTSGKVDWRISELALLSETFGVPMGELVGPAEVAP